MFVFIYILNYEGKKLVLYRIVVHKCTVYTDCIVCLSFGIRGGHLSISG